MPSDYDKIRNDEKRKDELLNNAIMLLGKMYSDRTHFIFELLQNAEDAGAAHILFELFEDRLEVKHDGRPFDERDLRGVCGVGEGTKAEDLTQIGKFGIGFKSVYAYTSTPEIHSGGEHFRIEHYVRPYKAATKVPGDAWTTLFVFAFDAAGLEPQTAMYEIAERLRNLSDRTLLFLRNIKEIEYKLPDETGGVYLRGEVSHGQARQVTVIGQNNGQDEDENWLVFERPLSVPDGADTVWVEIGFKLEDNSKDRNESIVRIKESPLVVYFPTEKSTRFGFLIQGPYRTTPSRDNIPKDDDWNAKLVEETALLLVDALQSLKKMGLLTVALLNALPIRMDDFPEDGMFYPIVEAVRDALLDQELLPADDGTFVSARNAKLARVAELRKLLTHDQLRELFQSDDDLKWLSGEITLDRTPDLRSYLIRELDVEEIRPETFIELLTDEFLQAQTDTWIIQFYNFLGNDRSKLWKKPDSVLRKKKILRLEDNFHVIPFRADGRPNAYLPSSSKTNFPTIKKNIFEDKGSEEFFRNLGLFEPDLFAEVIEFVFPKYTEGSFQGDFQENIEDLRKVSKVLNTPLHTKSQNSIGKLKILLSKLGLDGLLEYFEKQTEPGKLIPVLLNMVLPSIKFLRAINGNREEYKTAKEIYLNTDELCMFFENNPDVWFLDKTYPEDLEPLFKKLSVGVCPRVKRESKNDKGQVVIRDSHGWHERGLNGFDPDIEVDGLKNALKHPTLEKSLFIWNRIAIENSDCIRGIIESSSRKTYEDSKKQEKISHNFGRLLMATPWLPDKQGNFHKPAELKLDDLPESFVRDEKLVNQLGMKKDVVAKLAEEAGISQDTINIAKELENHPELLEEFRKKIQSGTPNREGAETEAVCDSIDFGNELESAFNKPGKIQNARDELQGNDGRVNDPERRRDKLGKEIEEDKAGEPPNEERFRKIPRKVWEGKNYKARIFLKEQYAGKCQICGQTFTKRDGEPYFEGLYLVSRKNARWIDRAGNILCLCANHTAQFQHGSVEAEDIKKQIMSFKTEKEGGTDKPVLRITLCKEECTITYTEKHLLDLQEIIAASDGGNNEAI